MRLLVLGFTFSKRIFGNRWRDRAVDTIVVSSGSWSGGFSGSGSYFCLGELVWAVGRSNGFRGRFLILFILLVRYERNS